MQREIDELKRVNVSSTQILHAIRSDHQVPAILDSLKGQDDLAVIADIANSLPATQSSVFTSPGTIEYISQATNNSTAGKDVGAVQEARELVPSRIIRWTSALRDGPFIEHLLSLYWTWIHPAYPLFSRDDFIRDYMRGSIERCSDFLVAAVCAAAGDLISPRGMTILGKDDDIAALRQSLVAEARVEEAIADHDAQTTLEASQVMMIVDARAQQ